MAFSHLKSRVGKADRTKRVRSATGGSLERALVIQLIVFMEICTIYQTDREKTLACSASQSLVEATIRAPRDTIRANEEIIEKWCYSGIKSTGSRGTKDTFVT